jgi:hypothetical protein
VETDTEAGTLTYSGPQTVYDRLSGTITWLPQVGDVVHPGGTLFKVDGLRVILMNGRTPAYRDLSADDDPGPDITELNRNLVRLGFGADAIAVDDEWQPATTTGVELLQESLGETATGILTLGNVVFLPGDQLVSTVDASLGATGSGGASTAAVAEPEFVSLRIGSGTATVTTTSTTSAGHAHTHPTTKRTKPRTPVPAPSDASTLKTLSALTRLLRAESTQLRSATAELRAQQASAKSGAAASSSSSNASATSGSGGGSGGAAATAVLQTTSTQAVVIVDLAASSQSEAVVGEHVTVELPDGNTVPGRITAVSPVAQAPSSASGSGGGASQGSGSGGSSANSSSTIPVTITLSGHTSGAGLDQAAVSVNFAQQRANHVLSVPVTALLAVAGGTYDVQEAGAPHHLIPVTTGLFAAGYVEISGPGIYPGLTVTDSQG